MTISFGGRSLLRSLQRWYWLALLLLTTSALALAPAHAAAETIEKFRIAWTTYPGWMPWFYAEQHGIIQKWAAKYHIAIELVHQENYLDSVRRYTAGEFDGCAMTNMDALTIPATAGLDSTALIIGDFSNGNDGIVLKNRQQMNDLVGQSVHLAVGSVSHYLLARALQTQGFDETDVHIIDVPDNQIVSTFASKTGNAAVTWNPHLSQLLNQPGSHKVFDSSYIPGEIIDLLVVRSDRLAAHPELGQALTGAWYEVMAIMSGADRQARQARTEMGQAAGSDLVGYEAQMVATRMFYRPLDAANFAESPELAKTMRQVAEFVARHHPSKRPATPGRLVGIEIPAGSYGDPQNVKLRFTGHFMRQAATTSP